MQGLTDRTLEPERMDDPEIPRAELEEAFRFIRRVNRRMGGAKALLQALARITRGWPRGRELSVIDLGTGCADIPLAVAGWADRHRRPVRIVAVDNHETTLAIARDAVASEPRITIAQADARRLLDIFDPGAFDVAHAGMFLHHLPDIEVVTVLRIMQRLGRAVVWNDLTRDAVSKIGVRLLTLGTPPVVRHDAIVSVAKGFTRREAIDLAKRAGLEQIEYRRFLFGRFVVVGSA